MSDLFMGGIPWDYSFFEGFDLPELLRATAWRTSALKGGLGHDVVGRPSYTAVAVPLMLAIVALFLSALVRRAVARKQI
jgi:hypothetical protein